MKSKQRGREGTENMRVCGLCRTKRNRRLQKHTFALIHGEHHCLALLNSMPESQEAGAANKREMQVNDMEGEVRTQQHA